VKALAETAYAKINLALHIRQRRADGYHELETLFAFCEDGDGLTAEPADELTLSISGEFADGLTTGPDNLVLRAASVLKEAHGLKAGANIHLDKRLPVAAGIGGGSADAAAALRLLSRLWSVDIPPELAASLGADVAACVASQTVRGVGVGDSLIAIDLRELSGTPILLVNPRLPCPTGPVFQAWNGVDHGPLGDWREGRNDLTDAATELVPEVQEVLQALQAVRVSEVVRMSGSGATCFGIFQSSALRSQAAEILTNGHPHWWVLASKLR
jgi:4-diphosphocytidyl-2-C-methyl-D-erythritol kinase